MEARRITAKFLAAAVFCLGLAQVLPAQYYSTLVGTVRDPAGAVMADTKVTATEVRTGVATVAVTSAEGEYRMATLRPGEYTVAVSKAGFKGKTISGIILLVGQTSRVDLPLELGSVSERVTVSGEAPLVQTETADRGAVLEHREIEALPLNTRNIAELAYLVPGAVKSSSYFEPMPSVNGLGGGSNQVYVDGNGLTSSYMMLPAERITIDSIQEFKIETANTTADHGLLAGSTISIATKHGTNSFHGTAFEFLRNDALNARNFFAKTVPSLRYNEFGANLGGPVVKNKLFFFFNYEASRERRAQTLSTTVPTAAERQGDFTAGTGAKNAAIFDPSNIDADGLRVPFPDNKIPQSRWNPIAQKYLAFWPATNTPGFPNFRLSAPSKNDFDRYAGRIDYNATQKDSFLFRIGYQSNPQLTPGPIPSAGTGTTGNLMNGRDLGGTWTHVVSPRSFNEAHFSFAKLLQSQIPSDFVGQNMSKQLGFANGDRVPQGIWGLPGISFSGVATRGVGGGAIWTFPNRTYYFADDYSFIRGKHNFKTGALHERYGIDTVYGTTGGVGSGFNGRYTTQIGDLSGGQPFADFLLGALPGVTVNENPQVSPDRRNFWQMYFMDDWKASSKLVLQLGLRYDLNLPAYMADGRAGAWIDGLDNRTGQVLVIPANGEAALKEVLKGQPLGFPYRIADNNWLAKPNWRNFGPRLGIAYRPFNDTKTVIRGGYGIYYNMSISTIQNNRNWGRPFITFGSTPPRPVVFEPPPYSLGDAPVLTSQFQPGEPFRSGYVASPNWPDARVQQWNVTFQRELGHEFVVEASYVGNKLDHGLNVSTWNTVHPVGYAFHYADGSTLTIADDTPLLQRVKYPQLGSGTSSWPTSHSTYQSGQFQLTKQMSHGLQFRAGYTRSRSYGQMGAYQDEWSLNTLNYYLANDQPNVFFTTYVWQLPGRELKGVPGALIGGWQLSGIINVQSGIRVNPYESQPQFLGAGTGGSDVYPILVHNPNLPSSKRTLNQWFDTSAFAQPGPDQYGSNSAIYSIRAAGLRNADIALSKFFKIREGHRIQFRGEFFNSLNHPLFGAPAATRGTATFGKVSSAGPAREGQVALKYEF